MPLEERAEVERIVVADERLRKAAGRFLVRQILSKYAGRDPSSLVFERNAHGKPRMAGGSIHHSLSHAGSWVALAIDSRPVGVDVEEVREGVDQGGVMGMVFSALERDWMLEGAGDQARFFGIWTAKEALLKFRGVGFREDPRLVCTRKPSEGEEWLALPAPCGYKAAMAGRFLSSRWGDKIRQVVAVEAPVGVVELDRTVWQAS